jgi:hypothetical protein
MVQHFQVGQQLLHKRPQCRWREGLLNEMLCLKLIAMLVKVSGGVGRHLHGDSAWAEVLEE